MVGGTQSAVFTFTYLHLAQGIQQGIPRIQTIEETPLEREPPLLSGEGRKHEAPAAWPSTLAALLRYLLCGPNTIRKTLAEHGPAEASIAASKFSGALFLTVIAGSLVVTCAFPCLLISAPFLSNPKLSDPLGVAYALPFVPVILAIILMLLSVLAAMGLALVAFSKRTEKKSKSVLALLLSVLILIVYSIFAFGVIGLAG